MLEDNRECEQEKSTGTISLETVGCVHSRGQAVFLIKFTVGLLDFVYKVYFYFWFIFQMPPLVG